MLKTERFFPLASHQGDLVFFSLILPCERLTGRRGNPPPTPSPPPPPPPPRSVASLPRFGPPLTNPGCTTVTGIAERHKGPCFPLMGVKKN